MPRPILFILNISATSKLYSKKLILKKLEKNELIRQKISHFMQKSYGWKCASYGRSDVNFKRMSK